MVHLGEVGPTIWDEILDELELKLQDEGFKRKDVQPDWRKLAHKGRFEREAFAKYGYFKDFILHPKVQLIKSYVEENVNFQDLVVGDPITSYTNTIILLFMLARRVDNSIVFLLGAFLFNLNPVYISLGILSMLLFTSSRQRPKGYIPPKPIKKIHQTYKPQKMTSQVVHDLEKTAYDHILLGNDLATMYTAALLARCGHKCLVLQPTSMNPVVLSADSNSKEKDSIPCSVSLQSTWISKIERYQPLVDMITSATGAGSSAKDNAANRLLFSSLGQKEDGFTHSIFKIFTLGNAAINHHQGQPTAKLLGPNSNSSSSGNNRGHQKHTYTIFGRLGASAFLTDLSQDFPLDLLMNQVQHIISRLTYHTQYLTNYFLSKIVSQEAWKKSTLAISSEPTKRMIGEMMNISNYDYLVNYEMMTMKNHGSEGAADRAIAASSSSSSSSVARQRLHQVLHSLAMCLGGNDDILGMEQMSSYTLAAAMMAIREGRFVSAGGMEAMIDRCAQLVASQGGMVLTEVDLKRLEVESTTTAAVTAGTAAGGTGGATGSRYRAVGVAIADPTAGAAASGKEISLTANKSVISGLGVLSTYLTLIPDIISTKTSSALLAGLQEKRPKLQVIFWIERQGEQQGEEQQKLSNLVYYTVRYDPALLSPDTSSSTPASSGGNSSGGSSDDSVMYHLWSPSAQDVDWKKSHPANLQVVIVECDVPSSCCRLVAATIPGSSAVATTDGEEDKEDDGDASKPCYLYMDVRQPESHPAHEHFADRYGRQLQLSTSRQAAFIATAEMMLLELYPWIQANNSHKIVHRHLQLPYLGGHKLANNLAKFSTCHTVGGNHITAPTEVKDFYLTGSDLAGAAGISGDLQAGWITANAALGYTMADLEASRSIIQDLR